MNAFGGGGNEAAGLLEGLGSLSNMNTDSQEVQKLKTELSQKTNEILQQADEKEELQN